MQRINKMRHMYSEQLAETPMRITVTNPKTDEVLYDDISKGGILCAVEDYKIINATEVEGQQQLCAWDSPVAVAHALSMAHVQLPREMSKFRRITEKVLEEFAEALGRDNKWSSCAKRCEDCGEHHS